MAMDVSKIHANLSSQSESSIHPGHGIGEVIPRFGIPSEISSDNKSALVQKVAKGILQQLRIKQRLGCVPPPIPRHGGKSYRDRESQNKQDLCKY